MSQPMSQPKSHPLFALDSSALAVCFLCLALTPLSLSACGEDEVATTQQRGIPAHMRRKSSPKSTPGAAQGAKATPGALDVTIPNRLKRKELLSSSGWRTSAEIRTQLEGMRDPFWPDIPELKDQEEVEVLEGFERTLK